MYLVSSKKFVFYCRFVCCALSVRDTVRGRHSRLLPCSRSHVLRAYCKFESKQANSITLFGPRPNNNIYIIKCCDFPLCRGRESNLSSFSTLITLAEYKTRTEARGRGHWDARDVGTCGTGTRGTLMIIAKVGGKCDISFFVKMC